ncbi:uncharacterized protein [Periplaneta americana]|uniref:uncharacterized protein n=1 Tax=Periplaneta americana TaxID=6978 RepID=UPI0037E76733
MYVIFPAEEVVELTLGGIVSQQNLQHHLLQQEQGTSTFTLLHRELGEQQNLQHNQPARRGTISSSKKTKEQKRKSHSKTTKKSKQQHNKTEDKQGNQEDDSNMASGGEITLRDLSHPSLNEALKAHNSVTFKLVRTGE